MPELGVSQALRRRVHLSQSPSLSPLRPERHLLILAHFLHAQVLSPGDVAFTLGAGNDSYIVSNSAEWDPNNICMSLTSLIGGLVMLLGQSLSYIGKISIRESFYVAMPINDFSELFSKMSNISFQTKRGGQANWSEQNPQF